MTEGSDGSEKSDLGTTAAAQAKAIKKKYQELWGIVAGAVVITAAVVTFVLRDPKPTPPSVDPPVVKADPWHNVKLKLWVRPTGLHVVSNADNIDAADLAKIYLTVRPKAPLQTGGGEPPILFEHRLRGDSWAIDGKAFLTSLHAGGNVNLEAFAGLADHNASNSEKGGLPSSQGGDEIGFSIASGRATAKEERPGITFGSLGLLSAGETLQSDVTITPAMTVRGSTRTVKIELTFSIELESL